MKLTGLGLDIQPKLVFLTFTVFFLISVVITFEGWTAYEFAITISRLKFALWAVLFVVMFICTFKTYILGGITISLLYFMCMIVDYTLIIEKCCADLTLAVAADFKGYLISFIMFGIASFIIKLAILSESKLSEMFKMEVIKKVF